MSDPMKHIDIRASGSEIRAAKRRAKASNMTLSAYARRAINEAPIYDIDVGSAIVKVRAHDDKMIDIVIHGRGDTRKPVRACWCGCALREGELAPTQCAPTTAAFAVIGYEPYEATQP